jgi:hypothetical protein
VDEVGVVEYEHEGKTWSLPRDLVALQVEIARADAACRAAVAANDDVALSEARAVRLKLVVEKFAKAASWWDTFENYERWKADAALKAYARGAVPDVVERSPGAV